MMSSIPLEKLKEEIDAKKRFISTLPPCENRSEEGFFKAKHLKILAQKEEEYELILESQRVALVVREHEELYPPITEECPICLEDIRITALDSMVVFTCCGNGYCMKCRQASRCQGVNRMASCPLCRAEWPSEEESISLIKQRADDGRSWAQTQVGVWYFNGSDGFPVDRREALKWFELAADSRHTPALYLLSYIYMEGLDGIVRQSDSTAMSLMKDAADLGYSEAQYELAEMYLDRNSGGEDQRKAALYMTLAYSQDQYPLSAASLMGNFFYSGFGGLSKSLYLAKYYLEEAAGKRCDAAHCPLAMTLLQLGDLQYKGMDDIPGHCCIPMVLFWARKAAVREDYSKADAIKLIGQLERVLKKHCANCVRGATRFSGKMKQCARCKAAWYCGRECQLEHWKDGHKTDCIKQK